MNEGTHISDPRRTTRRRVLELKRSGANAGEIARALGITQQRVYQHVKALRGSGLLKEDPS